MNTAHFSRRRFIRISATSALAALCPVNAASSNPVTFRWSGTALGAHTSLDIVHSDKTEAAGLAMAARAEIERLERLFSLYRDDSLLLKLNERGELMAPPADMLSLFSIVDGIHRVTKGAFDPTVQRIWRDTVSKFSDSGRQYSESGNQSLSKGAIETWKHVHFNSNRVYFAKSGMAITLNGIAQGYISEQVAKLLRRLGLRNVLVNVGEIVALGHRQDGQHWQVGIAEQETDEVEESVTLANSAIATSAPLALRPDTRSIADHIIDPATGAPCNSQWRRLTVIHPSAAVADGLSTGLLMHTPESIKHALCEYPKARVIAVGLSGDRMNLVGRAVAC